MKHQPTDFSNQTVIVTGASSGVGEATARLFSKLGAHVVLAARSEKTLGVLAQELGQNALAVPCDVSQTQDCERLIDETLKTFGRIDVLVNNAGFNARGELQDVSIVDIEQVIEVNLKAPMRLTRMVLPHMQNAGRGCVINVASLAGRFPLDGEASYSASKFGLRAFSLALAEELRESTLNVCLVSPGPIDTGFIMSDIEEVPDLVFSQPMSSAQDIAQSIMLCALDGKRERAVPAASGMLATAGYLLPGLRRALKPVLEAQGKRSKAKYLARKDW